MIKSKNRITKNEINQFPIISFRGEIVVVDSVEKSQKYQEELIKHSYIGVDTETRPAFSKGEVYPVSLVQFAAEDKVYIFQLKHCGFDTVKCILESESIKKIGLGLRDDFKDLKKFYCDFEEMNIYDLSKIAKSKGIVQTGVRTLSVRYLEHRVSKSMQVSNWAKKDLSEKQLRYAATDAWICLKIYPLIYDDSTNYFELKQLEDESMKSERKNQS